MVQLVNSWHYKAHRCSEGHTGAGMEYKAHISGKTAASETATVDTE